MRMPLLDRQACSLRAALESAFNLPDFTVARLARHTLAKAHVEHPEEADHRIEGVTSLLEAALDPRVRDLVRARVKPGCEAALRKAVEAGRPLPHQRWLSIANEDPRSEQR